MLHRVDSPICPPKKQQSSSITLWLLIIVDKAWKTNQAEFFSFDMFTLQNLAKNLGACKPTFHTFYTSHLRWNSTMRRCFYQTDLRQNAVFHNFSRNCTHSIFNIEARVGFLAKPFKKFPKSPIRPASSHFWQAQNLQWTLKELRFNIRRNLFCLFFI